MLMSKYLVEASIKAGLFEPYEPCKYYLMSREMLSKMLLQRITSKMDLDMPLNYQQKKH